MAQMLHDPQSAQREAAPVDAQRQESGPSRVTVFLHSFFFVLGFTAVFTLLGAAAGLFGRNLNSYHAKRNISHQVI